MVALAEQVVRTLRERGLTVAVAESCTGGLIGHLLTDVPGSSAVFPGGIVAYANTPKRDLLGVTEALLRTHGAVSAEVAAAMAEGVRRILRTDIGLAVTGIAGPTGGSAEKPIGTVFIACDAPSGVTVEHHVWTAEDQLEAEAGSASREHNKHKSAMAALALLWRRLEEG